MGLHLEELPNQSYERKMMGRVGKGGGAVGSQWGVFNLR